MGADGRHPCSCKPACSTVSSETTPLQKRVEGQAPTLLKAPVSLVQSLSRQLSWQFLGSVVITNHLLKGIVAGGGDEGLIGKPIEFLLGAQHVPAARLQAHISIGATAPWVLKPLIGFLSDTVPIMGYKKRYYLVIMTVLAIGAVAALGCSLASSPLAIVGCFFFASLQVAGGTLLVDAKLSETTKERPDLGPQIVSFKETCMNSGMIMSAMLVGPLIAHAGPRAPYAVALPLVAALLVIPMGNWLQERPLRPEDERTQVSPVRSNPVLFGLGTLLLPLLLLLAFGSVLQLQQHTLTILAAAAALLIVGGYLLLIRPEISGPMVFYLVLRCTSLQISGALFYFLTDPYAAFPEGPNFSPLFYATCITAVAISGRLIGFLTAKDLFSNWHYRQLLGLTVPLVAFTQLLLVPMLLRWNVAMGIPDSLWILAWTFLDMVARGWRHFPIAVLMFHTTPKGLEASTMALNTGAVNFGMTLSFFFGSYALHFFQVGPMGHPGESMAFDGLWKVQMLAALLPVAVLPLMPLCVPRGKQVERLIVENPSSATHGALLIRCCGV